jgi:uncharacterized protein YdhG (YjbR/CyaY superfamily)
MAGDGDRTRFWPAIERKHAQPIDHWLGLVRAVPSGKYQDQIDALRQGYGFSQAHANAVVMYARGSASAKRFATLDDYLADADPTAQRTARAILKVITRTHPDAEIVIAWNQPMVKIDHDYVFGLSIQKRHILIAPWGTRALTELQPRLEAYTPNKKTIPVPLDWDIDEQLVADLVAERLIELANE